MTLWSTLFPDEALLIGRTWIKDPIAGGASYTVPSGATYMRAFALGCGGQGDNIGGGGALAISTVPVTAGEIIKAYAGDTHSGSTPGDSWVKRNDGTVICYADRGRGNGNAGLSSNSIGGTRISGSPGSPSGVGGAAASDAALYAALGFMGAGAVQNPPGPTAAAGYGGGGHQIPIYDEFGTYLGATAYPARTGLVCLEFWDADPGF